MVKRALLLGLWSLFWLVLPTQAQKVKSATFSYLPESSQDLYTRRVPHKTLTLNDGSGFIILAHQAAGSYAVERYDANLKRQWSATIPVAPGETLEAFGRNARQAWVVLHHVDGPTQTLNVVPVELATGQKGSPKVLISAPARDRRPTVSIAPGGQRLLAYRFVMLRENQVSSIEAEMYDQNLLPVQQRSYDFSEQGSLFSPSAHIADDGTQYVTLVSDGMKKLTVRRYPAAKTAPATVMGVPVGGTYSGRAVTIRDARFTVLEDGNLYAAALCADYETGALSSLKVVRYDFTGQGEMKFSPEFPFDADYLKELGQATGRPVTRLDDVFLADMLLTAEKQLVVLVEKRYESGETTPVHARELLAFGYNEFGKNIWHSIIAKDQTAPAADAYTGIGFRAALFGQTLQLLTLETINSKPDLYLRRLNVQSGVLTEPERLRLNVADDQSLAYAKDFTTWLDAQTIIAVSRPSKKSAALQLNKVVFK